MSKYRVIENGLGEFVLEEATCTFSGSPPREYWKVNERYKNKKDALRQIKELQKAAHNLKLEYQVKEVILEVEI